VTSAKEYIDFVIRKGIELAGNENMKMKRWKGGFERERCRR
jgi:hypothetical protein